MKRRIFRIAVLALGGLIGLAITLLLVARHMGAGTIQEWIGTQIQDIANGYLNPKLSFTDLDYQYPLTVSLKNLHLTADDPANPGHTIDIIACDRAEVSLADIPTIGKPIVIEKIALEEPLISAVAVEPRSKKFVGFSNLIRGASDTSESSTASSAPKKLSDVFRMRLVQIDNGKIVYDPRIPGTVPMTLDKINTLLNIEPTDAGWYKLDTDIARVPVFDFAVKGQLNLDTFSVKDVDVKLLADLGQDKLDYLPPEIQTLLKQYEAKGRLTVEVKGDMPVMDPMSGNIQATVDLDRANIALSGLRIPVDKLHLESDFNQGKVDLPMLSIAALGGTAVLSGSVSLNDRLDGELSVMISSLAPGRVLANPNMSPAWEDTLDLKLHLKAALLSLIDKAPPPRNAPLAAIDLRDFHFSARDPVNPGQRLDLLACKKLDVDMTQPYISGQPLKIDAINLDSPVISAVSLSPGAMQFVGIPAYSPPPEPAVPAPAETVATQPLTPASKITNTFQVKSFQFTNAKLIYDPRLPGTDRMCLDQFSTFITVDPKDSGSYRLRADIDHSPIFKLGVDGLVDIDNPGIQNLVFDLQADLSQGKLDFLPPQLQLILRHVNAREKLSVHAAAAVAMSNPSNASAHLDMHVQNIDLSQSGINIPVQDFKLSANLQHKKAVEDIRISTLNNNFDIHAATDLDSRMDTDVTLGLNNIVLEQLLAALKPDEPKLSSTTTFNAQIELQSPLMVALGAIPGTPAEPLATATLRKISLTSSDNPLGASPLDFFACDSVKLVMPELPAPGKPLNIGDILIERPVIKAIAIAPQPSQFAGFYELQSFAAAQVPPSSASPAPATLPSAPITQAKLSQFFHLHSLRLNDAYIYYDPQIPDTTPMAYDNISARVNLDSPAGDWYYFNALVPSPPDLKLSVWGRADIDTLALNPVNLELSTHIGQESPDYKYLPPQVQVLMRPFDPVATIDVKSTGTVLLTNPINSDLMPQIALDNVKVTAGGYRIPIEQVSLPLHYTPGQVEFLRSQNMGLPTVSALDGVANITGTVMLNDRLDSTLSVKVYDILIQSLMADKIDGPAKDLFGDVTMDLELLDAPVLQILADATPPATQPSTQPSMQAGNFAGSPKYMVVGGLPPNWGTCDLQVVRARLAGLEVLQGVTNLAKSAFTDLFDKKDKDEKRTVVPKENARIVCNFSGDRINLTQIHYEGELLAADGKGYVTLEQALDLYLTGGIFQKFGGFIKQISDSLLYYHVYGTFQNIQYEVHRGDGKPIVQGVKTGVKKAASGLKVGFHAMDTGINHAGSFLHGLFNHNKQNQNPPQDQSANPPTTQN
jgi:hypothetical protein